MSLSIKLVFNNEIHRLTRLPQSFQHLQSYCSSIFHYPSFNMRYEDEEGDLITIGSDLDLQTAISSSSSIRSLRLLLTLPNSVEVPSSSFEKASSESSLNGVKSLNSSQFTQEERPQVWPRHTCDGCDTKPIVGPRFHCTVCGDFDFCETCERETPHEHPFMKFVRDTEDHYVNIDFNPENLFQSLMEIRKFFCSQKPKMMVKSEVNLKGIMKEDEVIRWQVFNNGNCAWPSGCVVEKVKGNIDAEFLNVPQLAPGQDGEILARIRWANGELYGKWKVCTSNGLKIGKIKAKGFLENGMNEKIQVLVEMGCDAILAQEVILKAEGNLEQAVKLLFP